MSEPEATQDLWAPWEDDPSDLYENAPCGYLTTLPDGTIVRVNETFLSWTGLKRSDLVGRRRFRDLLSTGGQLYHETHYAPLLAMQDDVHEIAFDIVRANGERLPALVNSVMHRDDAGRPRVIRTTVLNATERRGYERELLAARRLAEESERRVRVLQRIVADLAAAPTEAEAAAAVVRAPEPAFGATSSSVWLMDADRAQLVSVTSTDPAAAGHDDVSLKARHAVADVARRGTVHISGSVSEAERDYPDLAATMRRNGRDTAVLIPLSAVGTEEKDGPEVLGVLAFDFAEERALSETELRMAEMLGQQAGQALDRARLYDDLRRSEERATFLVSVTRAMEETHRLRPRSRRLVDRLVPEVADWAAVDLRVGPDGMRTEAGSTSPDAGWLTETIDAVAVGGEPRFLDTGPESGACPDCAVLPLTARGRVIGTLSLRMTPARHTASAEAGFLLDLADRAGLALENARLYEQERVIAQTLQRSLLAGEPPHDSRFAVETHYQPAGYDLEIGGDWFDVFLINTDKLAVVVGDVVGRGIDAATTMGQLRSAVRALATAEAGPARLLERLDDFTDRVESARMTTLAYAEVDLGTGEMTYACAGHLPPLLHEPTAPPRFLFDGRSAPLGSRAGRRPRAERRVRLVGGSRLLLYTDGLVERRDRPLDASLQVLAREYARRRDAPLPGLPAKLADTMVGRGHTDDVCLLCLALGAEERLERAIGADPAQIALLRKDLRGWLAGHQVAEESAQAILLAMSEAVANSIDHGYRDDPFGQVEVVARISAEAIEVRVTDHGVWRTPDDSEPEGRGLDLIRRMMDRVTIDRSNGTTVTLRKDRREAR
ncbi:SpoIIE family protein phosphatase [Mangrovihabitans endophyticus]|nr:SpoIIE family protein phosphatase [Mangrovihabitans endophyticus]